MHKLSAEEFVSFLAPFIDTQNQLTDWINACIFMKAAYGPDAYKLTTVVDDYGYYDDENYSRAFTEVTVYDQNNNELQIDSKLPFLQAIIKEYPYDEEEDAIQSYLFDHTSPPIPLKNATYIVDTPPGKFPNLYVED